ncbi:hypothetical protein [Burkholderia sp. LMG 21824]|uniref:hypothetical protein n=1 Tax=Burkholderia sp. LMG 21824 TaxID=3158172 RepID=UPI003C2F35B1
MGMQDITGVFALPLAHPYSDVPPPYGRRRTPFVASRRPRPSVFDLRVTREPFEAPRIAAVRAADFGTENRAWAASHGRRRLRPTLMTLLVGLVFGSVCVAATHIIDIRKRAPSPDTFYEAAISVTPEAGVAAPVAAVVAPESMQPVADRQESFAMQTDSPAAKNPQEIVTTVVPAAAPTPATAPSRKHARIAPARPPAASTASVAPAAASAAAPKVRAARHDDAALAAASSSGSAAAVGMTAAEFTRWLAATREPARQSAQLASPADTGVAFTDHSRLIEP